MPDLRRLFAAALVASACQPIPEPPPDPHAYEPRSVATEPAAPLDHAPPVLRLRIEPPLSASDEPLLVSDELSDYHLGRIQKRDLPKTLLERVVPALVWANDDTTWIAPSRELGAEERYTLASPELGRIGSLQIAAEGAAPLFARVWPPPDAGVGSARLVYCGATDVELEATAVLLDPGAIEAVASASERCVSLSSLTAPPAGTRLVPPPELAGVSLDPAPIAHSAHAEPADAVCVPGELRFGPGCAGVEDDRVIVRSRPEAALWIVRGGPISLLEPAAADGHLVVRGFAPASVATLDVTVLDLGGRERRASVMIETEPARPRLVIDEVLANALGAEPMQEWVELVNDGVTVVDTGGFVLEDLGGSVALPSGVLAPGQRALVVREDFVEDDGLDVVPAADTVLLRVPTLGKSGLANSGEPLLLRAADGSIASRFPPLAASKAGVSMARRRSWDLDDDPQAFGRHAEPGASPGAVNVIED